MNKVSCQFVQKKRKYVYIHTNYWLTLHLSYFHIVVHLKNPPENNDILFRKKNKSHDEHLHDTAK